MRTPLVRRMPNKWLAVYAPKPRLMLLISPLGADHVRAEVSIETWVKVANADTAELADRQVDAVCDLHFAPEQVSKTAVSRSWAELADLTQMAEVIGYERLRASRDAVYDLADIRADGSLESVLCERDADCDGNHVWFWVPDDEFGEELIYHVDYDHGTIVPPKPLELERS